MPPDQTLPSTTRLPSVILAFVGTLVGAAIAVGGTPGVLQAQTPAYRFEVPDLEGLRWFKGNTHTHTTESDGDSSPEYVARWYKEHGYDFLVLSGTTTSSPTHGRCGPWSIRLFCSSPARR